MDTRQEIRTTAEIDHRVEYRDEDVVRKERREWLAQRRRLAQRRKLAKR